MEVILVRVTKNGKTIEVPLAHERTLVGRLDDCHIRVPIAGISRKHCEIAVADGSIVITDLGSSNGTYVNQDKVSSQPLSAGDLISFAGLVFVVKVNGEPGDIDAKMMFEDGLPDEPVSDGAIKNAPAPIKSMSVAKDDSVDISSKIGDMDDSSMMDFEFNLDDDEDDQPPL